MSKQIPALNRATDLKDHQRVPGCISEVYLCAKVDGNGMIELEGTSDSLLARGILGLLKYSFKFIPADLIHCVSSDMLVSASGGLFEAFPPGRLNGLGNMLRITQQQLARVLPISNTNTIVEPQSSSVIQIHNDEIEVGVDYDSSNSNSNTNENGIKVKGYDKSEIISLLERYSNDVSKSDYKLEGSEDEVAMLLSGGVDSSVALKLLLDQGYKVRAFYLKIWLEDELSHLNECPWEEDLTYAVKVCEKLNVPLETVSLQKEYWDEVVNYTLNEARMGRTPNPDIMCNSRIKFGMFYDYIGKHFKYVATGHYARIQRDEEDKGKDVYLKQSPDPVKDQTYFLCNLRQDQLNKAIFPIGHMQKEQVRQLASKFDLPTKARKDSQGICFLGKLKFDDFIEHYLGQQPGLVKVVESTDTLEAGKVVGEHKGLWFHTIGQRKGLGPLFTIPGVVNEGPWFVAAKDLQNNILHITNNIEVIREKSRCIFHVENLNWINGVPETLKRGEDTEFMVKIRHSPEISPCVVLNDSDAVGVDVGMSIDSNSISRVTVRLDKVEKGVAPGQFAAFYKDDICVGAGVIAS